MKIVIALMQHETNTFSPLPTPYKAFAGPTGLSAPAIGPQAAAIFKNSGTAFGAFIELAEKAGAEIDTPIAALAMPSGPVFDDAYEQMANRICDAVSKGCDAVMLDLHGAMVTQSLDDGEGELLWRIRQINPTIPIAVSLDFHANITAKMVSNATVMTGYCTYPHIDVKETGMRAGRLLLRTLTGDIRPRLHWGKLPLMSHTLKPTTTEQPMKDIMDMAIAAERDGVVHSASVFGGFPLSDIEHVGFSVVITSDDSQNRSGKLLCRLLEMGWERRQDFVYETEPISHAIAKAKALDDDGPVVIVDEGDNCFSGGGVDNMAVIKEILHQKLENVVTGPIWDPEALTTMTEAGIGATVTLPVGGKTDSPAIGLAGEPLTLTGKVKLVTDGRFEMDGFPIDLGGSAVLDTGRLELVVCGQRWEPGELACIAHTGIDLGRKNYIVLKSRQHFKIGFASIAKHMIIVSGPGVCSSDYRQFPFKHLKRPIYPLDKDTRWSYKT